MKRKTGVTIAFAGQVLVTQEPIAADMQLIAVVQKLGQDFRDPSESKNG